MKGNYKQNVLLLEIIGILLFLNACTKSNSVKVPLLYAFFNANNTNIFTGDSIQFKDESLGYPQKWSWSFEGGNPSTSTEENPAVVFDSSGSYKVTLTVTNGNHSSTKVVENYIVVAQTINLNDGLIAFFPFGGSDTDAGPNSLAIKTVGDITFGDDRHSNPNGAAIFDGSSALIIPNNSVLDLGTSDFTISCWVKTNQTSKMMIWQDAGAGGSKDNQAWLRIGDNSTDKLIRFDVEDSGGGNILNYGNGPETGLADNKWHNVVCVREGSITRLYIDGVKKEELAKSTIKDVSNSEDFKIGTQEGPAGSYHTFFNGSLDDVRIYNKALSDLAIAALYKQ